MELTFIITDDWYYQMTGVNNKKRTVKINLTEDQINQLGIRKVGSSYNQETKQQEPKYETIQEVFVETKI